MWSIWCMWTKNFFSTKYKTWKYRYARYQNWSSRLVFHILRSPKHAGPQMANSYFIMISFNMTEAGHVLVSKPLLIISPKYLTGIYYLSKTHAEPDHAERKWDVQNWRWRRLTEKGFFAWRKKRWVGKTLEISKRLTWRRLAKILCVFWSEGSNLGK